MKPTDFIARIAPIAVNLRLDGSFIFPSLRIAQAAHETGWTIHPWNNIVGYKVGSLGTTAYWDGRSVYTKTWEVYDGIRHDNVSANWRVYDSVEDCFRDQDILFKFKRYDRVRSAQSPYQQAEMLQASGYATDPKYAAKLIKIIDDYGLKKYDEEVLLVLENIEKLERRVKELENQTKKLTAPIWFVKEFGSADLGGIINNPVGTDEFWRGLAISLRIKNK